MQVKFNLVKQARSSGGDRYEAELNSRTWTVYFPQEISRKGGDVKQQLVINIDVD